MSKFHVSRSLKQLYIEKHAVEYLIARKKTDMAINGYEPTVREVFDLRLEEAFLEAIKKDIDFANQRIKRDIIVYGYETCDVCGKNLIISKSEVFFVGDENGSHVYCEEHWKESGNGTV